MTIEQVVLGTTALVFLGVAVTGLFTPRRIIEPLGGAITTPSMANEMRANYGGMHLGIATLMALGAARPAYQTPALLLLLTFTAGLCLGRAVSWVLDGAPNRYIRIFFALEVVGVGVAVALLTR